MSTAPTRRLRTTTTTHEDDDTPAETPKSQTSSHARTAVWRAVAVLTLVLAIFACYTLAPKIRAGGAQRTVSRAELARHDGKDGRPIWLSVGGEVFDVSDGAKHYGPGGGYSFFAATDGTRAYITGEFEKEINDNIDDFTDEQCLGVVDWAKFYHETYKFVGVLAGGAFFDNSGTPTARRVSLLSRADSAKAAQALAKEQEKQFPACSSRWTQQDGGTVWCDAGEYPRRIDKPSAPGGVVAERCACFSDVGVNDQRRLYDGCAPHSSKCSTSKPKTNV
ncbi:cytochrome b5 heme-binding domain-containing protein [Pycnococcus provasolii]